MKHARRYRGSVLLMVVGLLTMIAMLGGTFLIIARLDARQSDALAVRAQADPIARGLAIDVLHLLKDDLYIDGKGTSSAGDDVIYGAAPSGANGWRCYIDHPDYEIDPHLSSSWRDGIVQWRYLTNLLGKTRSEGGFHDIGLQTSDLDPNKYNYVDTDGDGGRDARLMETGATDPRGRKFYAAVRVVDLASFLCANTAYSDDWKKLTDPMSPCGVDLSSFVGGWANGNILEKRCGSKREDNAQVYWEQCARRLTQPEPRIGNPDYEPYSVGEEMYLRYHDRSAQVCTTNFGRLPGCLEPHYVPQEVKERHKRLMTFMSCMQPRLRRATRAARPFTHRIALTHRTALDDPDTRQFLYRQLVDAGAEKRRAAHFAANLWAYISHPNHRDAFAFRPKRPDGSNELWEVYGVVEQLVISEAYAYSAAETDAGAANHGWAYALELFNPTGRTVEVASAGAGPVYRLKVGDKTYDFDDSSHIDKARSIGPGQRIVLYTYGGRIPPDHTTMAAMNDFGFHDGSTWRRVSILDDFDRHGAKLFSVYHKGTSSEVSVPIDSVQGSDFGYNVKDKRTERTGPVGTATVRDGRRDDNWTGWEPDRNRFGGRARATVAWYRQVGLAHNTCKNHKLAQGNNVNDISLDDVYEGFYIRRACEPPSNLGDLAEIFVVGPDSDGKDLPHVLLDYRTNVSRGRLDFRGAVPDPASVYPDVPWAAIVAELAEALPTEFPDGYSTDGRIYGRININTAERDVLRQLPWPEWIRIGDGQIRVDDAERETVLDYVLAYRDRTAYGSSPNYSNRAAATGIDRLRADAVSNCGGFLTPGEVAIPLSDYINRRIGWSSSAGVPHAAKRADYCSYGGEFMDNGVLRYKYNGRDALYRGISNLITVNSDMYAAYVRVQIGKGSETERVWNYLAVIDRSNCRSKSDVPALLMFTQLK
jgi:hypothetical protein